MTAAEEVAPGVRATGTAALVPGEPPGATIPAVRDTAVHRHRQDASLATLGKALDLLTADATRLAQAGDLQALAGGLARLRKFRRAVSDLERHVEGLAADLMPGKQVNYDDELTLERHRSVSRSGWQSEDLLRRLVGDQVVDPETGENVIGTLLACVPFTASLAWRVGALRERGIQVDEWCEEKTRTTVTVKVKEDDDG